MRKLILNTVSAVLIVCGPTFLLSFALHEETNREMVCYDHNGAVTFSDHEWSECRLEVVG